MNRNLNDSALYIKRSKGGGFLESVFVFFALILNFFPWLSFSLNTFDMQPWVIVLNTCLVLYFGRMSFNKYILGLYSILSLIFLLAALNLSYFSARAVASYYIFIVGIHFFVLVVGRFPRKFYKVLIFSNLIWVLFGVFQLFFGLDVFSSIVNLRSSSDRGMTSLAPEPTHFGFHLVFISWIYLLLNYAGYMKSRLCFILVLVNFFAVLTLAKSSMALLYFLIMIPLYFISKGVGLKILLLSLLSLTAFLLVTYFFVSFDEESRISHIVNGILKNPIDIIKNDASVNARLSHLFLSVFGAFESFFYPNGFESFEYNSYRLNQMIGGFFWYSYESNIIMSGTGSILYELGFLGLFLLMVVLILMMGGKWFDKFGFISFITLWILMIGAIPISYPLASAVIAVVSLITYGKFTFRNRV